MGSSENYCLRWNDFESNVSTAFRELRREADLFDVTLACDASHGRTLQAHRVILSACSIFFRQMLRGHSGHPKPIVYLRGVKMQHLEAVLDFMYNGEVNVSQSELAAFLAVAEDLQIRGLAQQQQSSAAVAAAAKNFGKINRSPVKRARVDDEEDEEASETIYVKSEMLPLPLTLPLPPQFERRQAAKSTAAAAAKGQQPQPKKTARRSNVAEQAFGGDIVVLGGNDGEEGLEHEDLIEESDHGDHGDDGFDAMADAAAADAAEGGDLNELVTGLLTLQDAVYTCNLCGKKSPWRTTMLRHVEANHVETAGHVCDLCGLVCKTRPAFAMHKKRRHNVSMTNEPVAPPPPRGKQKSYPRKPKIGGSHK